MPDEKTRADSLRLYLTGAASDGAAQTDPDASLGDYRSSSLEEFFTDTITNPISNVTVDFVSGAHSEGDGTLTATGNDSLAWTPPGGSQGAAVSIANGETKILEGSGVPGQFIRVTRTSTDNLTGAATVTLAKSYNNVLGMDNVSSAEASAGDVEYRAIMIKNESASEVKNVKVYLKELGTQQVSGSAQLAASGSGSIGVSVGSLSDWPDSGFCRIEDSGGSLKEIVYYSSRTSTVLTVPTAGRGLLGTSAQAGAATDKIYAVPGLRIAKEAPTANQISVVANESTQPSGLAWSTPVTSANGLDLGDLAVSALYGVWIERTVVAGAVSEATVRQALAWSFDAT
jgi:hypothetical protein